MEKQERVNFHERNYKVIEGNVSLTDAQIIVVGEIHRDRHVKTSRFFGIKQFYWTWSESREHVRELIETHAKSGDILLRESYKRGKVYSWRSSHEEFHTPAGVTTVGWDNMFWNRIDWYWQRRARKAFVRGDEEKMHYYDRKMDRSARRRNQSLHVAIMDTVQSLQEGQRLWVVAGKWHINNNYELISLLLSHKFIVIEAIARHELQKRSGVQGFP